MVWNFHSIVKTIASRREDQRTRPAGSIREIESATTQVRCDGRLGLGGTPAAGNGSRAYPFRLRRVERDQERPRLLRCCSAVSWHLEIEALLPVYCDSPIEANRLSPKSEQPTCQRKGERESYVVAATEKTVRDLDGLLGE
jgi:hypothetical protein